MHISRIACMLSILLLLAACSNEKQLAEEYPQIPSYAIAQNTKTALGNALRHEVAWHKEESGFHVMPTGSESFAMRLALIQAAEKTIDLQYYSINDDTTSNLLLKALMDAAERGVRVRFLLDSIDFDDVAPTFAVLDGIKNVEVRIFNPFSTRDQNLLTHMVREVTDIDEMNHRMHNKAMIADNQLSIIGGRNLGDEYFEENTDVTFRDLDILVAGPIVADVSKSFDQYWNDPNAYPLGRLRKPQKHTQMAQQIKEALREHWDRILQTPKGKKLLTSHLADKLKKNGINLIWAKAQLVADTPRKIKQGTDEAPSRPFSHLDQLAENAHSEFIIVSPYFVPRTDGVEWLKGLVEKGITVKILTNSLASTDMVAVHAGYRRYRKALVEDGIALYELKPVDGHRPTQRLIGRTAPAHAMLHAKLYIVDRRDVMVGSFNMDPRSIGINTELSLIIHSKPVAKEVIRMFNETTDPRSSYRVMEGPDDVGLVWEAQDKNGDITFGSDPHPGFWRSVKTDLMSLLPIEDQL